jgi:hypothetical protein
MSTLNCQLLSPGCLPQNLYCAFHLGGVDDAKCRSSSSSCGIIALSEYFELFHGRRSRLGQVLTALPFTSLIFNPLCQRYSLPNVFVFLILVMIGRGCEARVCKFRTLVNNLPLIEHTHLVSVWHLCVDRALNTGVGCCTLQGWRLCGRS